MNTFQEHPEQVGDKTYRRDWAQEQARKKLREMRGEGLSDVKIGKRLGDVSGVFIGAVLRQEDPKPVSKKLWDALIDKEGFQPIVPGQEPWQTRTEKVNQSAQSDDPRVVALFERMTVNVERLTQLLLEERQARRKAEEEVDALRQRLASRPQKVAK